MAAEDATYEEQQVVEEARNRTGLHYSITVESLYGDFSLSEVRDIAILSNYNLAVAQKTQITELDPDGRIVMSSWRPPTCCSTSSVASAAVASSLSERDNIMSFGVLKDDRLLVALYSSKRLVVLSRLSQPMRDVIGDEQSRHLSWIEDMVVPLSHSPQCISCCGDMVAVAITFVGGEPPPIKLFSLTKENIGKTLISRPMTVPVGCVALTKGLFLIAPWKQAHLLEPHNRGRSYVEAYAVTGAKLWTLPLVMTVRCMRFDAYGCVICVIGNDGALRVIDCGTCSMLADSMVVAKPLTVVSLGVSRDNTLVMVGSLRNAIELEDSQSKRRVDMTFLMKASASPCRQTS